MRRRLWCAAGVAAILVALPGEARAQGSAVQTHGSCATAMGAAGVASPCDDGSAILFNPAALARQRSVIGVGWTGINTSGSFTYDAALGGQTIERESSTSSVPFGFLSYRVGDRLAAGIGVFNPYGLHIFWPEDFEGRFVSYDTNLRNIYIQPTLSFAPNEWISIGAALDVIRSSIEINQRVDLATTPLPTSPGATFGNLGIPLGTEFADVRLSGDGSAYTYHVGVLVRLGERLSVGARYLGSAEIDFDGDADFSQISTQIILPPSNPISQPGNPFGISPGAAVPLDAVLQTQFAAGAALGDQGISTSLPVPAQLVVGVAFSPLSSLRFLADYQWTGWSEWDQAPIDFESAPDQTLVLDYQDTNTWRFGAEFGSRDALALRAGFIYNTAAQKEFSVSPLLPEAERNYYTLGLGYALAEGLRADVGYQLVDQSDRRGRVRSRPENLADEQALRALNVGVFTADAHVFNVTLSYRFGARR